MEEQQDFDHRAGHLVEVEDERHVGMNAAAERSNYEALDRPREQHPSQVEDQHGRPGAQAEREGGHEPISDVHGDIL
jgi:hypothetical protein